MIKFNNDNKIINFIIIIIIKKLFNLLIEK